jgi:hypothetical protein
MVMFYYNKILQENKRALLLDVVVGESADALELLAREDWGLLVGENAFCVLDLGLDVVDGVGRLHFKWMIWPVSVLTNSAGSSCPPTQ